MPTVLTDTLRFGEGPAFDANGDLWCTEIEGGGLVKFTNGSIERHSIGGGPSGLVFDEESRGIICDGENNAIRAFNPKNSETSILAKSVDGEPLAAPNDLAFGPDGELVFTCPGGSRYIPRGYVSCLSPDGSLRIIHDGLYFPNGLAFSPDGDRLFVAETTTHKIWKGEWDQAEREWRNPEPFVDIGGPVGPDGMAFDQSGNLIVAVFGSGELRVIDQMGNRVRTLEVPGRDPTNVAFDPTGDLGLVVTEADQGNLVSYPEFGEGAPHYTGSSAQWL